MGLRAEFELNDESSFWRNNAMLKVNLDLLALLAVSTTIASAQVTQEFAPGPPGAPAVGAFSPKAMVSIGGDFGDMTPVKGAPFCATVTTEHTQPFADG